MRALIVAGISLMFWVTPGYAGSVQAEMQKAPPEVLVFSTPDCSYCRQAKNFLLRRHIPFREVDLGTAEGMSTAEAMRLPPMAPVFSYKGRVLVGFSQERLLKLIEE